MSEPYPRLAHEARPVLCMPYRLRQDDQNRPSGAHLRHVGAVTADGLLVGYASALGGPGTWMPGRFRVVVFVDEV